MTGPELKIRDLLLMDWSEEEWKKLRDWLKQKAKKLNQDDATKSSTPHVRRPPPPIRWAEPSDPIFSKPTVLTFASHSMTSTESSDEDENQTRSEPDETSSASEGSQGEREILVPPGYSLEEWNRILDLY
jgi:hypothetical protein